MGLSDGILDPLLNALHPRDDAKVATYPYPYPLPSESHTRTLQILALVLASFSLAAAILTFYWFVKMRRVFRHK
jgi:hypothetical protein